MPGTVIVYSTFPDRKQAKVAATKLLRAGLIACAVMFRADSSYLENGKIVNLKEIIGFFKTGAKKSNLARAELLKIHPYKIPCILEISAKPNNSYFKWVLDELNAKEKIR